METKKLTKGVVEMVLRDRPTTRNSYESLCKTIKYMGYFDEARAYYFYNAIGRRARDIQNTRELYQSDKQIKKARKLKEDAYRTEYTPTKLDVQEQVLDHIMSRAGYTAVSG